jgi:hypothetical protein
MTAVRTISLTCDCGCGSTSAHRCHATYPPKPAPGTAKDLRADAASKGWQVVQHTSGEDVCPPCRIAKIRAAAEGVTVAADSVRAA